MTLLRRLDLRNPRTMHVRGFSCVTYHPPTTTSLFHVGTFTIEVTKKTILIQLNVTQKLIKPTHMVKLFDKYDSQLPER